MFGLFGKKERKARKINDARDLQLGDIIIFKDRLSLPEELRGQTAEVLKVATFEFESGFEPAFSLRTTGGEVFWLGIEDEDGETALCISKRIQRNSVEALFDLNQFENIFSQGFTTLKAKEPIPAEYKDWLSSDYQEVMDCVRGYFHDVDKRDSTALDGCNETVSTQELDYYECRGIDHTYGIAIEVYTSGETDVSLFRSFDDTVVQDYLPNEH